MFDQLVKRSDAVWIYTMRRFAEERRAFLCELSRGGQPSACREPLDEDPVSGRLSGGPTDVRGIPRRDRGLFRGLTGTARAKATGFTVNEGHLWWKCDPRQGA